MIAPLDALSLRNGSDLPLWDSVDRCEQGSTVCARPALMRHKRRAVGESGERCACVTLAAHRPGPRGRQRQVTWPIIDSSYASWILGETWLLSQRRTLMTGEVAFIFVPLLKMAARGQRPTVALRIVLVHLRPNEVLWQRGGSETARTNRDVPARWDRRQNVPPGRINILARLPGERWGLIDGARRGMRGAGKFERTGS